MRAKKFVVFPTFSRAPAASVVERRARAPRSLGGVRGASVRIAWQSFYIPIWCGVGDALRASARFGDRRARGLRGAVESGKWAENWVHMSKGKDFRAPRKRGFDDDGPMPYEPRPRGSRGVRRGAGRGLRRLPPMDSRLRAPRRRRRVRRSTPSSNGSRPTRAMASSSSPTGRATPSCTPTRCTPRGTRACRRAPSSR